MIEIMDILKIIKTVIDYAAIIIMVWGVCISLIRFIKGELTIRDDNQQILYRQSIRAYLATYILLGLEIFIVGDIIAIIINPTQDDLIVLVIIVFVRTIISYFLERDFKSTLTDINQLKEKK